MSKHPTYKRKPTSKPAVKSRPATKTKPVIKIKYVCEGYINEVAFGDKGKTKISISATDDFIVSAVKEGGKRLLLLQNDDKNAVLVDANTFFLIGRKVDAETLLALKVNRLKIRLEFDGSLSGNKISALRVL